MLATCTWIFEENSRDGSCMSSLSPNLKQIRYWRGGRLDHPPMVGVQLGTSRSDDAHGLILFDDDAVTTLNNLRTKRTAATADEGVVQWTHDPDYFHWKNPESNKYLLREAKHFFGSVYKGIPCDQYLYRPQLVGVYRPGTAATQQFIDDAKRYIHSHTPKLTEKFSAKDRRGVLAFSTKVAATIPKAVASLVWGGLQAMGEGAEKLHTYTHRL